MQHDALSAFSEADKDMDVCVVNSMFYLRRRWRCRHPIPSMWSWFVLVVVSIAMSVNGNQVGCAEKKGAHTTYIKGCVLLPSVTAIKHKPNKMNLLSMGDDYQRVHLAFLSTTRRDLPDLGTQSISLLFCTRSRVGSPSKSREDPFGSMILGPRAPGKMYFYFTVDSHAPRTRADTTSYLFKETIANTYTSETPLKARRDDQDQSHQWTHWHPPAPSSESLSKSR